jgi:hypothetical protein
MEGDKCTWLEWIAYGLLLNCLMIESNLPLDTLVITII